MSLNPEEFLNQTTTDATSTQLEQVAEGEYSAVVKELTLREFKIKTGERAGQTGYSLDLNWLVQDEGEAARLERPPIVRQSMFMDMTQDGSIDHSKGKNVTLGRLREATGQNTPGKPWSPGLLKGAIAIVKVEHTIDGENIYANVKRVAQV